MSRRVSPIRSLAGARGRAVDARVVGIAREVDLALLKVDVTGLPALPFADYETLRQGELVFAFGSPEGLRNRALESARHLKISVVLDLSRVRLIDRPTTQYLVDVMQHDVRLANCPDHIERWIYREWLRTLND